MGTINLRFKRRRREHSIRNLLLSHLPDFCYQTPYEILIMLEAMEPDTGELNINPDELRVVICQMTTSGDIQKRKLRLGTMHLSVFGTLKGATGKYGHEYALNPRSRVTIAKIAPDLVKYRPHLGGPYGRAEARTQTPSG